MRREQRNVESKNDHTTYLKQNESSQYYQYVNYIYHIFLKLVECNLIDGEERDHKEQPYSMSWLGSSAENLHKTELAFLFMSLTALMIQVLSSKLLCQNMPKMSDFFKKWQCDIIEQNSWNIARSMTMTKTY